MQRHLTNQSILIAGGSRGIGKAVAQACLNAGAHIAIAARNPVLLEQTRAELQASASNGPQVFAYAADISDPSAVEELIATVISKLPNFSGLVNCAAVLGPKGDLDEIAIDEWIRAIQVNLIGTMLLCRAVLPHFRARRYGKIVNFSGGGATSPRPRFGAYAASKTAVVRLTENLARELAEAGIRVNAISPGAVNTRMLDELLEAGPAQVGEAVYQQAIHQKENGGAPAENAANLCVMLLSNTGDGITGRLISAVWDPWESLPARTHELASTDVYTLRRIVPADRDLDWS
jgi:NAD(P)-dependent dehydrogenase (short-subunit alcohol dehydrogenase family)